MQPEVQKGFRSSGQPQWLAHSKQSRLLGSRGTRQLSSLWQKCTDLMVRAHPQPVLYLVHVAVPTQHMHTATRRRIQQATTSTKPTTESVDMLSTGIHQRLGLGSNHRNHTVHTLGTIKCAHCLCTFGGKTLAGHQQAKRHCIQGRARTGCQEV
jgi:hypothetical protein